MITVADAVLHVLVAGPFQGRRVGDVAQTDEGFLELNRMATDDRTHGEDQLYLEAFFADPGVRQNLKRVQDQGMNASRPPLVA